MGKNKKQNFEIERKTEIQIGNTDYSKLNGCLTSILLIMLCFLAGTELKRSKIGLKIDEIKLERMKKDTIVPFVKDGTVTNSPDALKFDTLKIGKYQHVYIPLIRQYQKQKGE